VSFPSTPARSLILATDLYKYTVVLLFLVRYLRLGTRLISNAVVERMFSTMARMKPHLRNRMSRDRLDSLLRISEEGPSVKDYDPTAAIERWYGQKKRRIRFGGHAYPKKRKKKVETSDASRRHDYFWIKSRQKVTSLRNLTF
jgi:hypothetical protein